MYFFIGPQGCGKGTQGKKLAELRGIPHREMSALLSERRSKQDERGKFIGATMDKGDLVPSPIVIEVFTEAMRVNGWDEVIIDGFPRMLEQAEAATALVELGYDVQFVIFELDDEECLRRMAGRVQEFAEEQRRRQKQGLPPLKARGDEDLDKQKNRLALYRYNYPVIMEHLNAKAKSRIHQIQANRTVDEIFSDLLEELPLPAFKG